MRTNRLILMGLWFLAFSWEVGALARARHALQKTFEQTEAVTTALQRGTREITEAVNTVRAESKEMDFFQGLLAIMPEEKSYLRTQRAISEDVEDLRRKVGHRVRGE